MPWKTKFIVNLYTALILVLLCNNAYGAVEPYQQQLKGRIRNGDTLLLRDEKFRNAAYDWNLLVNRKVSNYITFGLLTDSVNQIHTPFTATLDIKVEYWSQPDQADPVTEDHITLTLRYDTARGVLIKPQDVHRFLNGHMVKITVNNISSPELGEELPGIFTLTSQVFVDRKYRSDPNAPAGQIFVTPVASQQAVSSNGMQTMSMPIEQTADKVILNWDKIDNSEEYDLEWTFVDETSANGGLLANEENWTNENLAKIFRNNATRVTLSQHSYTINLVHYSKYLLIRLRGVTTNEDQIRVEKSWNYDIKFTETGQEPVEQKGVVELANSWHHPDMNWQYNATYAEDGKRKEIVTYFDKSLKSRQVVTLTNNSNDPSSEDKVNVVAQSTIYDQYGRAAVNVLPAPLEANVLNYYPGLNKKTDGSAYTFMDVNPGGKLCDFTFPQMNNTTGAGKYYSANNPFQAEAFHKFVPDAEGYPFSGQFYTNDNTGRISVQGGVGKTFQPNADPSFTGTHATRYYYSKPTQRELYRMFGNDVGDASHYSKTTTIDPNGQIAISYQNLSGKTIATALSGPAPDNLDPLAGVAERTDQTFTLFNGSAFTFDPSKLTLSASQVYIAQETGSVSFDIDVPRILKQYAGTGICTECAYEGMLSISSDCMDDDLETPIVITGSGPSASCAPLDPISSRQVVNTTFSREGAYYITLELRLRENVIKQAAEQYVALNTSLRKQFDFVIDQLRATDFGGCFDNCKTCYTSLGIKTNFIQRIKERLTSQGVDVTANATVVDGWADSLYDRLSASCTALQANCFDDPCQMLRSQLLADVSPNGQYSLFDENGLPLERDINILFQKWRTVFPLKTPDESGYDAHMVQMGDGVQLSIHDASFTLQDLVAHWNPDWAPMFIEFHPEYCGLEICERNSIYLKWDERVKSLAVTAADISVVLPGKQYNRSVPAWLASADPYFASGAPGNAYAAAFIADLENYSANVKKLTGKTNKSLTAFVDFMLYCGTPDGNTNSLTSDDNWTDCSPNSSCRVVDREWRMYLQSYMELKQFYYQKDRDENECSNKCKVGETVTLSGCPAAGAFSLMEGAVSGTSRELIVRHEGGPLPKATVVTLFYPSEYNGLTQVPSVTFAAGESQRTVSIHSDIPVNQISVKNVTCTPGVPTFVCNGTSYVLELGSSGRRAGRNVWETVTAAGQLKTYYVKEGFSDEAPATPTGCSNAVKTFYNCLRIKYNSNGEGEYFQNVWLISCDAVYCMSSLDYTATKMFDQFTFGNIDTEIEIIPFTEQNNNLTTNRCTEAAKSWYSCLTVMYNGTVYTYRNATVFTCLQDGGGACDGGYITIDVEYGGGYEFYGYGKTYYVSYDQNFDPGCREGVEQLPQPACVRFVTPSFTFDWEGVYVSTCNSSGSALRGTNSSISPMSVPDPGFNQSITFNCAGMGHIAYQQFNSTGRVSWRVGYTGADILPNGYVSAIFSVAYTRNGIAFVEYFPVSFNSFNMTQIIEFGVNVPAAEAGNVNLTIVRPDCYAGGTVTGCPEAYKSKQSRLVNIDFNNTPVEDLEAVAQGQMQGLIQSACANQAESWLRQIDDCLQAYPEKRAELRDKLIELCSKGIDIKHPNGASTLPPGASVPGGAQSFKDVIVAVLGGLTMDCNPWLIDAPYPYKTPIQNNSLVVSYTDPDICAKLATLQSDFTAANPGVSFPQYLRGRFGSAMTLTDEEVIDLVNSCGNCKYLLKADIKLPVFLAVNEKGCITASELNTAFTELQSEGISGFSAAHRNYERIVSNYFNHRWGFTLGYPSYQKLLDTYATDPNGLLCNEPLFNSKPEDPYDCLLAQISHATRNGMMEYDKYIAEVKRQFRQDYIAACRQTKPVLKLTAKEGNYHYTLYYYDQAGQLMKTIPPAGVHLLTDAQIAEAEAAGGGEVVCNYVGPVSETPIVTTNSYLKTALSAGSRSIEMWLYQPSLPHGQLLFTTDVDGYLFNVCMGDKVMELDIYKLNSVGAGGVSLSGSRHFRMGYVNPAELNWLHLVIQGTDLGSGTGNLEIFVNGAQATPVTTGIVPPTCGWQLGFENGSLVLPSNTARLKHIRGYSRSLTAAEIMAQYKVACLGISGALASTPRDHWGRHNIPAAGGPTTVGGGTVETQRLPFYPAHRLSTTYSFTSLGGVYRQHTPDANESRFWYDRLGRLVSSRNAVQTDRTSYTKYDEQGRIIEVGERLAGGSWSNTFLDINQVNSYLNEALSSRKNIVTTLYDKPFNDVYYLSPQLSQSTLRKRVSASFAQQTPTSEKILTAYSYDMLGNAQTVYQYINWQLGLKRIDYKYDLASGKVNAVRYKTGDGNNDFFYNYKYDAENRLVRSLSGIEADGDDWEIANYATDAEYYYYRHGPLARMELGKHKVQGVDYAYTLQGWLKAINGQLLDDISATASFDMGADGFNGLGINSTVGKDVYAFTLDYYFGDYKPAVTNVFGYTGGYGDGSIPTRQLFNGNIARSTLTLPFLPAGQVNPMVGYTYRYDQLNRLKNLTHYADLMANPGTESPLYSEAIEYDPNGNIMTYNRYGNQAGSNGLMDGLTYRYNYNAEGFLENNQLKYIDDAVTEAGRYTTDIDDQGADNYSYDEIGNLTKDDAADIKKIDWTVYGKIASIEKENGLISYRYDAAGNRVYKESTIGGGNTKTWYVRDAQGNTMAVYSDNGSGITWDEQHLYGSSRLGYLKLGIPKGSTLTDPWNEEGRKHYELTNHLGNVMAVVSDKAPDVQKRPEILQLQDYYAFGMGMPGRSVTFGGSSYRYGFNGKENDNEVKGEGNQQDYGMRIYDPRVARFLSVDPLTRQYPHYTPYSFAGNKPIVFIDRDGEEEGIDLRLRRVEDAYFAKQISEDQYRNQVKAMGAPGVLGAAVVTDVFVTKGWLTRTMLVYNLYTLYDHNPAKTPEGRLEQEERFKDGLANLAITWGVGKIISGLTKVVQASSRKAFEYMYRVQGGGSKVRFVIDEVKQNIGIAGDDMLFVNIGQEGRALEFAAKRGDEAVILRMKVNSAFADKIRKDAVPQNIGRLNPGKPQTVDPTKAPDQYGLPKEYFDDLLKNIDQKSIEIITKPKN